MSNENSRPILQTFEDAQKDLAMRKERELRENRDPKTEGDRELDELRQEHPDEPDYDHL